MSSVSLFLGALISGVTIGCIYVLLASGLNLIFGVMELVNFAHGQLLMLGAYVCYWISTLLGLNPYIAILVAMAIVPLVGIAVERLCFRPVLGTGKLNEIFVSLGLINIFTYAVVLAWGYNVKIVTSPFDKLSVSVGVISIEFDRIMVIIIVALILVALFVLINKTKIGRAMRATSQNKEAAMLMGININNIYLVSFALGSALAATGGALYAIIYNLHPFMGELITIKAFAIIILGGLGSIRGAVAGGLLFGLAESLAGSFLSPIWEGAVAFAVLIGVLVIRPTGIFGEKGR